MAKGRNRAFGPPKPQFFKVLLPGFTSRLSIPWQFSKYIIQGICQRATILSPLGNSWQVKVHKDSNSLYFGDGWQEFVEAHDLDVGYFLVFSYEGEMVFSVTVFDRSTCIREYTLVAGNDWDKKIRREETQYPISCETSEAMEQERHSCEQPVVRKKKSLYSQYQKACTVRSSRMQKIKFKITIKPHNLPPKPYLRIPLSCQANNHLLGVDKVILRDQKMQLWPVKVHHPRVGDKLHNRFGRGWLGFCRNNKLEEGDVCIFELLIKGKTCTLHVNILKKCELPGVFDEKTCEKECTPAVGKSLEEEEIRKENSPEENDTNIRRLNVQSHERNISGAKKRKKCVNEGCEAVNQKVNSEDQEALEATCHFIQGPHFKVTLTRSNLHKSPYLNVPLTFRQHISDKFRSADGTLISRQMTLRDPGGRLWPVYLKRKIHFAKGWHQFSAGNKLEDGDACIFELVSKEDNLIQVHILRRDTAM